MTLRDSMTAFSDCNELSDSQNVSTQMLVITNITCLLSPHSIHIVYCETKYHVDTLSARNRIEQEPTEIF